MAEVTEAPKSRIAGKDDPSASDELSGRPRNAAAEDPEPGKLPSAVEKAVKGEDLSDREEMDATEWFLSDAPAVLEWEVPLKLATSDGRMVDVTWVLRGLDPKQIDRAEERNRAAKANDDGIRLIDYTQANAEVVAEATVSPDLAGARGKYAMPADALRARFVGQAGLIDGLAQQVRFISGYDPSRIGSASLRHLEAAKNS